MNMRETKRGLALMAAALLPVPAAGLAQGMAGHHGDTVPGRQAPAYQSHGMMGGMMGGMMVGTSPGFILAQKDALGLTADQVTRLDSLQQQAADAWQGHLAMMRKIHEQMGQVYQADSVDLDRYQQIVQQMASSGAAMHVQIARLGQEAEHVLTPEQRAKLDYGRQLLRTRGMHGGYGMSGGMGYGGMMGRGMMGGGMGYGGMMGGGMMGGGMMGGWHGAGMRGGPGSMGVGSCYGPTAPQDSSR